MSFEGLVGGLWINQMISLYAPYLLLLVLSSAGIYYGLGKVDYFEQKEDLHARITRVVISVIAGSLLSVLLRSLMFSFIGV